MGLVFCLDVLSDIYFNLHYKLLGTQFVNSNNHLFERNISFLPQFFLFNHKFNNDT